MLLRLYQENTHIEYFYLFIINMHLEIKSSAYSLFFSQNKI